MRAVSTASLLVAVAGGVRSRHTGRVNQQIKFQRALMLADRKQFEKAEALFREVVEFDATTIVGCQATVALGELISYADTDEAQALLEKAVENMEGHAGNDVLDWERRRVEELFAELAER